MCNRRSRPLCGTSYRPPGIAATRLHTAVLVRFDTDATSRDIISDGNRPKHICTAATLAHALAKGAVYCHRPI